jgi:hypothetical protein
MPEVIQGYFGDGSEWGMKIEYSVEEEPLGTAGSVKYVEDRLGERFVIVSGDALTDVNLTEALSFHEERGAEATLVLKKVDDPSEFGIVTVEEDGRVTDFMEKPDEEEVFSYTANTGIYILEPSVLDDIPEGQEYDWSKDQFPKMLEERRPLYGYVTEGYWEDIGNIEQYMGAQRAVLDGEVEGVEPAGRAAQRRRVRRARRAGGGGPVGGTRGPGGQRPVVFRCPRRSLLGAGVERLGGGGGLYRQEHRGRGVYDRRGGRVGRRPGHARMQHRPSGPSPGGERPGRRDQRGRGSHRHGGREPAPRRVDRGRGRVHRGCF